MKVSAGLRAILKNAHTGDNVDLLVDVTVAGERLNAELQSLSKTLSGIFHVVILEALAARPDLRDAIIHVHSFELSEHESPGPFAKENPNVSNN